MADTKKEEEKGEEELFVNAFGVFPEKRHLRLSMLDRFAFVAFADCLTLQFPLDENGKTIDGGHTWDLSGYDDEDPEGISIPGSKCGLAIPLCSDILDECLSCGHHRLLQNDFKKVAESIAKHVKKFGGGKNAYHIQCSLCDPQCRRSDPENTLRIMVKFWCVPPAYVPTE